MNVHAPKELQDKFPVFEFIGKPWTKSGLTWIRARHKIIHITWYYCFDWDRIVDDAWYRMEINERPRL